MNEDHPYRHRVRWVELGGVCCCGAIFLVGVAPAPLEGGLLALLWVGLLMGLGWLSPRIATVSIVHRWRHLGVVLPVLIGLAAHWVMAAHSGDLPWSTLQYQPQELHDEQVVVSLATVAQVEPELTVIHGPRQMRLVGPTENLRVGDEVYIGARYDHTTETLDADWVDVAHGRSAKRYLGASGLALLLALMLGRLTIHSQGWGIRG